MSEIKINCYPTDDPVRICSGARPGVEIKVEPCWRDRSRFLVHFVYDGRSILVVDWDGSSATPVEPEHVGKDI